VVAAHLYDSASWPHLVDLLADLTDGRPRVVLNVADVIFGRQLNGTYTPGITDLPIAVNCVDAAFPSDPAAALGDLRHTAGPAEPWRLAVLGDVYAACPHWPAPVTADPGTDDVAGLTTLLIVSTTGDNMTPYANGVALAEHLGAALLTYRGYRHTAYHADNDCVDDIVDAYLIDLHIPPTNTICEEDTPPP
jgi:hypothetical protein